MGWVQENIEIFMESNKDVFITFVHKSKAAPGRLYPFFFRSVTAVIPFCSISKTVNQFQSDAVY